MSFLKSLFGLSKEQVWRRLSDEIGANYIVLSRWKGDKVQAHAGDWIITLDTVSDDNNVYTRIRAPFINKDEFAFSIRRGGILSDLGKRFGMEDIEIGDPPFDRDFIVQSNNHEKIRVLLSNPGIRELIQSQPSFHLQIIDDEGWLRARFPERVDELIFKVLGIIKDLDRLKTLFELFGDVLHQLCHMDSAYEDDVQLHIDTLSGPGGEIKSDVLLWEGNSARRRAAEKLGRLHDPRAVQVLIDTLDDADDELRVIAIYALGEIGDTRAVPALLPVLTDAMRELTHSKRTALWHREANAALDKLGERESGSMLLEILSGDRARIPEVPERYRDAFIRGFLRVVKNPQEYSRESIVVNAALALSDIGAIEALSDIRSWFRQVQVDDKTKAELIQSIEHLESIAALPRPAGHNNDETDRLPKTPSNAMSQSDALPRIADTIPNNKFL